MKETDLSGQLLNPTLTNGYSGIVKRGRSQQLGVSAAQEA